MVSSTRLAVQTNHTYGMAVVRTPASSWAETAPVATPSAAIAAPENDWLRTMVVGSFVFDRRQASAATANTRDAVRAAVVIDVAARVPSDASSATSAKSAAH